MCIVIGVILVLYITYRLYQFLFPPPNIDPHGKYVLISGCDTGFGRGLAIELDKQGFNVFAGIYSEDSRALLVSELSSQAIVLCLDITQQAQIDAAYELVKTKTNCLHALVNNAGVDQDSMIDWITLDFMRKMMDVNFFGHVAMIKTFLPLLIVKRESRVVNLCSVAGYLVAPSMSSYCASKFALEAFSDCLRREMIAWGLRVSIVEPSYMRTPIIEGQVNRMRDIWNGLSADVKDRWGENFLKDLMNKRLNNTFIHYAEDPMKVVHALQHAVSSTVPRIRYRPGWQSSLFFFPLSMAPALLTDLLMSKARGSSVIPIGVRKQLKQ